MYKTVTASLHKEKKRQCWLCKLPIGKFRVTLKHKKEKKKEKKAIYPTTRRQYIKALPPPLICWRIVVIYSGYLRQSSI